MLYDLTVKQFSKMLTNLSQILVKAEEHASDKKLDMAELLNAQLASDQFNLCRQVQASCDAAKLAVARLTDNVETAPKHEDGEATLAQLQERITSVKDYIESFSEADFTNASDSQQKHPRWGDKYLTGYDFAVQFAIPNMYFHVTTAYSILRHHGLGIGKMDYLGALPFKD